MITFIKKLIRKIKQGMIQEMWLEAKWMYQYAKKYKLAIVYYIVLGIFGTGMGLAGSMASKYLIDAVTGYDVGNIGMIIIIILCMALGNILIKGATSRISARISLKVNNEIQADVYDRIMSTEWESIVQFHTGDLLNRLNGDVSTVADSVLGWIPSLFTNLVQFIGTLAVILYYDPSMAIIALMSAPVTVLMSKMLMTRMRYYNKYMRQVSSEVLACSEESFQNIQTIKSFNLIKYFGGRLRDVQKNYADMALDYNKYSIFTSSFMSLVSMIVSYATFGWGVYRLWSGSITYGTMTLFLQLSSNLSSGFSALISMVPEAIDATTSAGRIMAIVNLPTEYEEDRDILKISEISTEKKELEVYLSHINFGYKGRERVLEDACIYAKPHEIVAIIGPSGEGKTTLIRILLGLLNPTSGDAWLIDGSQNKTRISSETRMCFSYVPQGNTMFSGSIVDNLRMVKPEATEEEIISALEVACAYDFVEKLPEGIYSYIGENGDGFSEGQAQRLSIARAIIRDAPILLLDEATSALDPDTEREVLRGIMTYGRTHTCIITTHRLTVLEMCNRVYKINEKQISEYNK